MVFLPYLPNNYNNPSHCPLSTTFSGSRLPLPHSQSDIEMIEKMFGSYCFYFQMLTSVPPEHTTVLPMVCATIPRDHLAVSVSTCWYVHDFYFKQNFALVRINWTDSWCVRPLNKRPFFCVVKGLCLCHVLRRACLRNPSVRMNSAHVDLYRGIPFLILFSKPYVFCAFVVKLLINVILKSKLYYCLPSATYNFFFIYADLTSCKQLHDSNL